MHKERRLRSQEAAAPARVESAKKALLQEAALKGTEMHPDVIKLRQLQAQQAALVLAEGHPADSSATVQASSSTDLPKKKPRRSKSRALVGQSSGTLEVHFLAPAKLRI